jgi:Na+/phosphate symporter
VSRDLFALAAFCFGAGAIVIYFVALAMRPRMVRVLNGSGLFFTGLGLIQAAVWFRDTPASVAWFNRDVAIGALCLAAAIQSLSVLRNRRAWDGVDRRGEAPDGAPA